MYFGGAYFLYRDVFDRTPTLDELISLLRDLNASQASAYLCQVNAEIRLANREKETVAKTQQVLSGSFLDDETVDRFKKRFRSTHMADRPVFHPTQILNILRLVIQHSTGLENSTDDIAVRYTLGTACLMMNDLLLTKEEEAEITSGTDQSRMQALMTQMLGPFEVMNTASITHVIYRSRIMFHVLLREKSVFERIKNECDGFDFEQEFSRILGLSLSGWLFLLFAFYAYLAHYIGQDGTRHPEYLGIDRNKFRGESHITQMDLDAVLKSISLPRAEFKRILGEPRSTDWRFDFVPFKSKPLIELEPDKFFCPDIGLLVEKMHSGVHWAIHEGLTQSSRPELFKAWGILFEEYVNWFLGDRQFKQPLVFFPSPKWSDGTESFDGAFMQDSRFMPMEYKGGFLKTEARYSGSKEVFESELGRKVATGCDQLAWKIQALFDITAKNRKKLKDVPLDHVTRVVPVLVVQDQILRGPFLNWRLNKIFNDRLNRSRLRLGVTVDSLNLVGISELETMAESAEGGTFDIFHALQLRCFDDREMSSELHNFLMTVPGYGKGKSGRIEKILGEQWEEIESYLFGMSRKA